MRSVIVDHVRERGAQKRGGEAPQPLGDTLADLLADETLLPAVDGAITAPGAIDEHAHQVVELRYFGGPTEEAVADVLEISTATVKRDWRRSRAFLYDDIVAN